MQYFDLIKGKIKTRINITLSTIGAAAAANLLFVFKIPHSKDDKLTKSKKGKVILVNSVAKLNFSGSYKNLELLNKLERSKYFNN